MRFQYPDSRPSTGGRPTAREDRSRPDAAPAGAASVGRSAADPLVEAFERRVWLYPLSHVLIGPAGTVTTEDLDGLSRVAGRALASADGGAPEPGEPVAFQSPDGAGFLAGLVALLRAGSVPVLLDARTPPAERRRIGAALGVTRSFGCDCAWPSARRDHWRLEDLRPADESSKKPGTWEALPPGSVVKLTSGTSGAARGILTPTRCLLADDEALTATMGIHSGDRLLAAIPMSHSYGLSSLVIPALARGQTLILPGARGPLAPLDAAADADATVFPTVPAFLAGLVRLAAAPPLTHSLRLVLTAGAPLDAETSARFYRHYGQPVHVFYGSSETGGICYDREGGAAERGTVGAPVEGVSVAIEPFGDPNASNGEQGAERRVVVRSAAVAEGYLPDGDGRLANGRFETEDLAVWRHGELALCGRLGDVINVRGKKVNPREVEEVIRRLPAVGDVAVLASRNDRAGERRGLDGRVRAVIACRPGELTREQVLGWCREHLADHKRPRHVVLVERLPRTGRGKLDRAALAHLGADARERKAEERDG